MSIVRHVAWVFPLLWVGATKQLSPLVITIALFLAALPLIFPKNILGAPLRRNSLNGGVFLFGLTALGGVWVSYNPRLSLPMFFSVLGALGVFMIFANATLSSKDLSAIIAGAGGVLAFYFISQYSYLNYDTEIGFFPTLGRFTGSIFPAWGHFSPHPNAVATFLVGAFFLAAVCVWQTRNHWRWAWGTVLLLIVYGILVSNSRGAWMGLSVSVILVLILYAKDRWRRVVGIVFGIVLGGGVGLLGIAALTGRISELSGIRALAAVVGSRWMLYRNSWHLLADFPLTGVGLGDAFAMTYSRYQLLIDVPYLYYPHNIFLAIWLGQGILGVLVWGWIIIQFYRLVWRVEKSTPYNRRLLRFRAGWLAVTATLAHGLFDSAQFSPDHWTLSMLFALMGMSVLVGRRILRGESEYQAQQWRTAHRWRIGLSFGALFIIVAMLFSQQIDELWHINIGSIYHARADLNVDDPRMPAVVSMAHAQRAFEAVLAMDAENPVANRHLGMVALSQDDFPAAVSYLEKSYAQEYYNQPTIKGLGYAYLWTSQMQPAEALFQRVEFKSRLLEELNHWVWLRNMQNQPDLARRAAEMYDNLAR